MYERGKSPRIMLLCNLNAGYSNKLENSVKEEQKRFIFEAHNSGIFVFDTKFLIFHYLKTTYHMDMKFSAQL